MSTARHPIRTTYSALMPVQRIARPMHCLTGDVSGVSLYPTSEYADVFEDDMPSPLEGLHAESGERRFCLGMLHQAWHDHLAGIAPYAAAARAWMLGLHDGIAPFAWCCEAVGLEPSYIRSGLTRPREPQHEQGSTISARVRFSWRDPTKRAVRMAKLKATRARREAKENATHA